MRIACLLVPDLPLLAALRAEPELRGTPLVITSGPGSRAEILSASRDALQRGIRLRQTLPQARAVCPDLVARIASPILEIATRDALLDVGLSLAPRAELAERAAGHFVSEGVVYIDASGIEALHHNEGRFASVLHARAEQTGLGGVVSIASSRGIARLAARHLVHAEAGFGTPRQPAREETALIQVLDPQRELAFLAPLPVDLLDPDDRTAQALTRFGIHRIEDLLRLSRRDLAARLGPGLLSLVARARGEEVEPPLSEPTSTRLEEGLELESPLEHLEALAFVLRGLVSRLVERLQLRSLGCGELDLELRLEGGGRVRRRIPMASPHQDERVLLRLIRLAIESDPPAAAIEGVGLASEGVSLRREQLDLFLPRGPSPAELDQTLAELGSLCGNERVGAPSLVDSHRPDVFDMEPFSPRSGAPRRQSGPKRAHSRRPRAPSPRKAPLRPRLGLRAIRPPVHAEVRIERGRPTFLRSAVSQGEVLEAAGPWRTTGHWWSESEHFAVDHYDVQMSDGTVLRLCFDWKTRWWQIDGLYD